MTSTRLRHNSQRWQRATSIAPLLALLVLAACAPVRKPQPPAERPAPASTAASAAPADMDNDANASLASIVSSKLQHGDYAGGEKALRRYLAEHPGDRPAKALLHQLTDDPKRRLGRQSQVYVVRAGDSYSTLAARYLGNPGLFLILARYNGSTNPSVLLVGEKVHLPLSAANESTPAHAASSEATGVDATADASDGPAAAATLANAAASPDPNLAAESPVARAQRLQRESVVLAGQGHKQQALARLDQALVIQPQLKSSGPKATSLRNELVAEFHQRAIVLYRDQHLDQAIALWDRVLDIEPNYEPAAIYRARALELKRRLKQL